MKIRIFGATAQRLEPSAKDVESCRREIEGVRRYIKRLPDPTCTTAEARQIEANVRQVRVHTEIADQAKRIKLDRNR